MRFFYRQDGSRVKVSRPVYERRKKRQAARIRKKGLQVWETRDGKQKGVTEAQYFALQNKRENARKAAVVGWKAVRQTKKTREYPGPTIEVRSHADMAEFRERLYRWSVEAVRTDGRMGRLRVRARIESTAFGPGVEMDPVTDVQDLLLVSDQKILGKDRKAFNFSLAALVEDVKGLRPDSPKKDDDGDEMEADGRVSEFQFAGGRPSEFQYSSGGEVDASQDGRVADRGWFAVFDSRIVITSI